MTTPRGSSPTRVTEPTPEGNVTGTKTKPTDATGVETPLTTVVPTGEKSESMKTESVTTPKGFRQTTVTGQTPQEKLTTTQTKPTNITGMETSLTTVVPTGRKSESVRTESVTTPRRFSQTSVTGPLSYARLTAHET